MCHTEADIESLQHLTWCSHDARLHCHSGLGTHQGHPNMLTMMVSLCLIRMSALVTKLTTLSNLRLCLQVVSSQLLLTHAACVWTDSNAQPQRRMLAQCEPAVQLS